VNEPLIRKDLIKFIEYAKDAGIVDIYLSTNGVLLTEQFSINLINSGLTRIQISIDATSADIYDQMRPGGDFKKVVDNISTLLEVRKKLNSGNDFDVGFRLFFGGYDPKKQDDYANKIFFNSLVVRYSF
jgi:MoaA/NifB/PqqE/SkfB family radical SAM enzyme